ncbi:outer membrane beta-barrel protein [Pseudooceanicola sp. CBS1P-1]|uniref:Outer membrane beta-barrel protein n=1 Tax=Pseudooceanicola albus TaxID=2692189 RepID=A0A6L7G9Q2_9RHOB|nr:MULTISPECIES: outer membrane beta-barrel protein [Pseudooceanicola]MBT9385895.1 outer membrane beta-barrel protein [Pseudooceanicola endophyticus]MXN20126.1 outer membrane beta-barrel protein [Pseudooceanicola albus]
MKKQNSLRPRRAAASASALALLLGASLASPAAAETEINVFGGIQEAPHSRIKGWTPETGDFSKLIGWEGKSFAAPPYYGARVTQWIGGGDWGLGLEFTHDKVYAPKGDMSPEFTTLEFTDGLNIVTVNAARRWRNAWHGMTPYLSGGMGVAIPHVEVTPTGGSATKEYQLTGPAMRLTAGLSYPLSDSWSVFGEYQFTASDNKADLKDDGHLKSTILTNALNVGVGFRF